MELVLKLCIILIIKIYTITEAQNVTTTTTAAPTPAPTPAPVPDNPATTKKEDENPKHVVDDIFSVKAEVWCKLQANRYDCAKGGITKRYYFDIALEDCREAEVGRKCSVDMNMFTSISSCRSACLDAGIELIKSNKYGYNVTCRLQPESGSCGNYYPRFYYNLSEKKCRGFSFSGCGGNANRFETFDDCSNACEPVVTEY